MTTLKSAMVDTSKLKLKSENRGSKYDAACDNALAAKPGQAVQIPIPAGAKPEHFRNTVYAALRERCGRDGVNPYLFRTMLTADEKAVALVRLTEKEGEDRLSRVIDRTKPVAEAKPKAAKKAKAKK